MSALFQQKFPAQIVAETPLTLTRDGQEWTFGVEGFSGDEGVGGVGGMVPAPEAGDAAAGKFLKADGTWAVPTTSAGGTDGQIQYNDGGDIGGFTVTGDGTLDPTTGELIVTKTNGSTLGGLAIVTPGDGVEAALAINTNVAGGVPVLDGGGKVPTSLLPAATVGSIAYQGVWDADTNTPTIPAAAGGNLGYYYVVSVAGTTNIDGETDWGLHDWIISNGSTWDKIDNSDAVTSVAGKVGAVVLNSGDVSGLGSLATITPGSGVASALVLDANTVGGLATYPVVTQGFSLITSNTTATAGLHYYCVASAASFTLNLPAAPATNAVVRVTVDLGGVFANYVTINGNGANVYGTWMSARASVNVNGDGTEILCRYDGSAWKIIVIKAGILQAQTAAASASLSFASWICPLYKDFELIIDDWVHSNANTTTRFRWSTNAGVSYDASAIYDWSTMMHQLDTNVTPGYFRVSNDSGVSLFANNSNQGPPQAASTTMPIRLQMILFNPWDTTYYKAIKAHGSGMLNSSGLAYQFNLHGRYRSASAVNAFQLIVAAGTCSGVAYVRGII